MHSQLRTASLIPKMRDYATLDELVSHLLATGMDPEEVNRIAGDLTSEDGELRSQSPTCTQTTVFPR